MDELVSTLILHNPASGKKRTNRKALQALRAYCKQNQDAALVLVRDERTVRSALAARKPTLSTVVCSGGDGTLSAVVNALIDLGLQTPICHIAVGTTNDFAKSIGIPHSVEAALALCRRGQPTSFDCGTINEDRHFTYVAAFGAFVNTSYNTNQRMKNLLGRIAYYLSSIKNLYTLHPYRATVEAPGISIQGDFLFGYVSNAVSIGGIIHTNAGLAELRDGNLDVCLVRFPQSLRQWLDIVRALPHGVDESFPHSEHFSAPAMRFRVEGGVPWTLDGEGYGRITEARIKALPRAFRILREPAGEQPTQPQQ